MIVEQCKTLRKEPSKRKEATKLKGFLSQTESFLDPFILSKLLKLKGIILGYEQFKYIKKIKSRHK